MSSEFAEERYQDKREMGKQNRKNRATQRIRSIQSKLDSGETRTHLQTFLTGYVLCEMACKELIVGHKNEIGQHIDYKDVKMDLRVLKPALNHYGINISEEARNRLFSSDPKSAKKIRDSLVHGISKKSIDMLNRKYQQIMHDMLEFMNYFTD